MVKVGWVFFLFSLVLERPVDRTAALGQHDKRYVLWKSCAVFLLCSSKVDQMQDIVTGNAAFY